MARQQPITTVEIVEGPAGLKSKVIRNSQEDYNLYSTVFGIIIEDPYGNLESKIDVLEYGRKNTGFIQFIISYEDIIKIKERLEVKVSNGICEDIEEATCKNNLHDELISLNDVVIDIVRELLNEKRPVEKSIKVYLEEFTRDTLIYWLKAS